MAIKQRPRIHPKTLEKVAYHEAGHVVVGFTLRIGELVWVRITPDNAAGNHGCVYWRYLEGKSHVQWFYNIVHDFAGVEAVRLLRGRVTAQDYETSFGTDLKNAHRTIATLGNDNLAFKIHQRPDKIARLILQQSRTALDAIAKALMKKHELSGAEAYYIWTAATMKRPRTKQRIMRLTRPGPEPPPSRKRRVAYPV